MPVRREAQRSYLKVGVLVIVALSAVAALILLISGTRGDLFSGKFRVRAYFENSSGLKVGAPVNLDGITIGNVRAIRLVEQPKHTPVEVIMAIKEKFRSNLRTDSSARLKTIGVLGNTEVDIDNLHSHGQPIQNDAVLPTNETSNFQNALQSFQSTTQKISTIVGQVDTLGKNLSSDKGSIGKFINDPSFHKHTVTAMNQISSIAKQVGSGKGSLGKFRTDHSLSNHLKDTVAKLDSIKTDINSGKGTAGKFIKDPAFRNNLKEASKQLNQISEEVKSGHGAIGMMLKDPAFSKELRHTREQLSAIRAQANAGKGTLGKFIKNPSLHSNLNELVSKSKRLATAIRKNPRKYFAIRFRLF